MSHPISAAIIPLALALVQIAGVPRPTAAQAALQPRPVGIGFGGGIIIPTGPAGDLQSTGWNIEGIAEWLPPGSAIGVRGGVSYASLGGRTIRVGNTSIGADDRHLLALTGNVVWQLNRGLPDEVAPRTTTYLLLGIGVFRTTGHRTATTSTGNDRIDEGSTKLGLAAGGGLRYRLGGTSLFAELRLYNVFDGALGDQNDRASARYFPLLVGIRVP